MILPFWRLEICKGSQWAKSKIQAALRSFLGAPEGSWLSCLFQSPQAVFLGPRLPEHFHSKRWPVECLSHCVTVPLPSCSPSPFKDPRITVVSPVYPTIQSSQCQPINHLNIIVTWCFPAMKHHTSRVPRDWALASLEVIILPTTNLCSNFGRISHRHCISLN